MTMPTKVNRSLRILANLPYPVPIAKGELGTARYFHGFGAADTGRPVTACSDLVISVTNGISHTRKPALRAAEELAPGPTAPGVRQPR